MFSGSRRSSSNRGSSSRGGYFSSSHHQPVVNIDVAEIEKMFADIADETNDQIATMEGMFVCMYAYITVYNKLCSVSCNVDCIRTTYSTYIIIT